jgi:hypothetical protein
MKSFKELYDEKLKEDRELWEVRQKIADLKVKEIELNNAIADKNYPQKLRDAWARENNPDCEHEMERNGWAGEFTRKFKCKKCGVESKFGVGNTFPIPMEAFSL